MGFSIYFGEWTDSGRRRERRSSTSSFFTPLDPFGNNPDEEKLHDDYTVPQKVHYKNL